jgi:ribosomal protein L4
VRTILCKLHLQVIALFLDHKGASKKEYKMAISSINFQKVSTHSLKHNDRTEEKTAKTVFQEFSHKNICDTDSKSALQNFNELYKDSISKVVGKESCCKHQTKYNNGRFKKSSKAHRKRIWF